MLNFEHCIGVYGRRHRGEEQMLLRLARIAYADLKTGGSLLFAWKAGHCRANCCAIWPRWTTAKREASRCASAVKPTAGGQGNLSEVDTFSDNPTGSRAWDGGACFPHHLPHQTETLGRDKAGDTGAHVRLWAHRCADDGDTDAGRSRRGRGAAGTRAHWRSAAAVQGRGGAVRASAGHRGRLRVLRGCLPWGCGEARVRAMHQIGARGVYYNGRDSGPPWMVADG